MAIDQTLNTLGQDFFKSGYYLVGNIPYANYKTDGVNDQVEVQQAVDQCLANIASNTATGTNLPTAVRIVSDLNFVANSSYTEVLGSTNRRLAVRLRDGVQIVIQNGVTISFGSGGNSGFNGGTVFTSAFGNFGNLTGASVICEGINAFDGLSTTSGTSTDRHSVIWLDARSNSCSTLKDCKFVISGRRTAGDMIRFYNSNSGGTSILRNVQLEILDSQNCFTGGLIERNGESITATIQNISDTIADGFIVKDGVENSVFNINRIYQAGTNGLKVFIDTAVSTKFNDIQVKVGNIELSGEHNIYINGMDGFLEASVWNAQKAGVYFEPVVLSGTNYYSKKLILNNIIAKNNNQSGGTFGGIQGVARNLELIGFDCSDTQGSPAQYRGVDLVDSRCDFNILVSGKAENNTNANIRLFGVDSRVEKGVIGFDRRVDVGGGVTRTIDGAEDTFILRDGSILKLPKFSSLDDKMPHEFTVKCIAGQAQIEATQEDDLSFKVIDSLASGQALNIAVNQSYKIIKFADRWRTFNVSHPSPSVVTLGASGTLTGGNTFGLVDTSAGAYTKTLPAVANFLGGTIELEKISKDFNVATFNRAGGDVIESYTTPANPPVATSIQLALPNERVRLTATSSGILRAERVKNFAFMKAIVYRGGSNQVVATSTADAVLLLGSRYYDRMYDVDNAVGWTLSPDYTFIAPVSGEYRFNWSLRGNSIDTVFDSALQFYKTSTASYVASHFGSSANPTAGADKSSAGTATVTLNKGEFVRLVVSNRGATNALNVLFEPSVDLATRQRPVGTYVETFLIDTTY